MNIDEALFRETEGDPLVYHGTDHEDDLTERSERVEVDPDEDGVEEDQNDDED